MKKWYRTWKRKAAFVLSFCILLGGIVELPIPKLSAASLGAGIALEPDRNAAGGQNGAGALAEPDAGESDDAATVSGNDAGALAAPGSETAGGQNGILTSTPANRESSAKEAVLYAADRAGGTDRTNDTDEVGIQISGLTVLDASSRPLACTGPVLSDGAYEYDASSNAYYDVAKVKFRMAITVKKNDEDRNLREGDYVLLPIPAGFSGSGSGTMTDASGTVPIASCEISGSILKITFAESVNAEKRNNNIMGGMYIELDFDAGALKGADKLVTVAPDRGPGEPAIVLRLPGEPDTIDGIAKLGRLDQRTNEILWTIRVGTDKLSKGVSLDGVELTENLPEALELGEITAQNAAGADVPVTMEGNVLTLSGANAAAPVTVTVKTTIKESALQDAVTAARAELTLSNNVSMGSSDPLLQFGANTSADSSVSVRLSPEVRKQGVQIDSHTIRWTIQVNGQDAVRIYRGYVVDQLAPGLQYKEGSITCSQGPVSQVPDEPQTAGSWPAHQLWVKAEGTVQTLYFYMAEDTDDSYTITFDTIVPDDFVPEGGASRVHNEAAVHAQFPVGSGTIPVKYGIPGIDADFHTAKVNKEVSADGTKATGQLTWTIYPSVRSSTYTAANITDVIAANQRYCPGTLKIYENTVGGWTDRTAGLKTDNIFTAAYAEGSRTLTLTFDKAAAGSTGHSTVLGDYKIEYATDALTYLQTNNTPDTYENTARLEVTEGSTVYTSQGTASAKLQNQWVAKKTQFEYSADGTPCFHYTITVNQREIKDLTNVTITDSIANAVRLSGDGTDVSEDWQFDTGRTKVLVGGSAVTAGITYSDSDREVQIRLDTLSEKAAVELYAVYTGGKDKLTTGIYANQKVYSDNTAEVSSDQVAAPGGMAIAVNSNTHNTEEMDNTLVRKECIGITSAGGTKLVWRVIINPNSGQMGQITIRDRVAKTQKYIEDSVMLYEAVYLGGVWQPAGAGVAQPAAFAVTATERSMELTVNAENKPLILEYQTALLDSGMGKAENEIQVSGGGTDYGTGMGEKDLSGGNWGSLTSAGTLILQKQDASIGSDMPLAGAEFTIYEDAAGTKPVDVGETGADGKVIFYGLDVPADSLTETYYYRETRAPKGYEEDTAVYPVIVEKGRKTTHTVGNIRKTQQVRPSEVTLTKEFYYWDAAGAKRQTAGKQAAFALTFYPYGAGNPTGAKRVSLTGSDGSYTYDASLSGGATVTEIRSSADTGELVITGLPWGYYGIRETETAAGFRLDTQERYFEIRNNDDMEVVYGFGDNPGGDNGVLSNTAIWFQAAAYEEGTANPVSGIRLQICQKNPDGTRGDVVTDALNGNAAYEWDTDGTPETIYNLPAGTYFLHEDADGGTNLKYAVAKDVEFTVLPDGTIKGVADSTVKIYHKTITLRIAKVDQFDEPVADATLQMTGISTGTSAYRESGTTTDTGNILSFGDLVRGGEYTLTEAAPPDAEHLAIEPINVKVSQDGHSFTFTQAGADGDTVLALNGDGTLHVVDRKLFLPITIRKTDGIASDLFLAGAEFKLYGQPLTAVGDIWTEFCEIETGADGSWEMSGLADTVKNPFDSGKELSLGLKPGRYYLEEIKAPDGYKALPDGARIKFEITEEGIIRVDAAAYPMEVSGTAFTISDMPLTLRIQPLAFDNGSDQGMGGIDLNGTGAVYKVTGNFICADGTIRQDTVELSGTEEDAFVLANGLRGRLIPNEVYTITETTAPEGYLAPEPVCVKLDTQGRAVLCDESGSITVYPYCRTENEESLMDGAAYGYDGLVKIYHGKTKAQLVKYTSWNREENREETEKVNYKTLSGITFTLEGKFAGAQTRKEYVTDAEGRIDFEGELVVGETYTLTEAPQAGYKAPDAVTFTYSATAGISLSAGAPGNVTAGSRDGIPTLEITNQSAQNTSLQFLVYDCTDGTGIPGARFRLTCIPEGGGPAAETVIVTNEAGNVYTYVTAGEIHEKLTAAGEAFVTDLQPGTYTLEQIESPYGYNLGENGISVTFQVDAEAQNKTIVINEANVRNGAYHLTAAGDGPRVVSKGICYQRVAGTVVIEKQDYDDGTPLNGVGFAVYRYQEADNVFEFLRNLVTGNAYAVVGNAWTEVGTDDGRIGITGLEWGRYYIVETDPLTGYAADKTRHDFEIGRDRLTQVLEWTPGTLTNAKIQLIIPPTISGSGQMNAAGRRMRISGRFQNTALSSIEWEETEEGYVIAGMLLPGEIYTLEESVALPGYQSGARLQFKYNGYGQIEMVSGDDTAEILVEEDGTVKLVRTAEPIRVRIRKTDEDGNLLAGAVLSLYVQEAGARVPVAEALTDGSPWELTGDQYSLLRVGAVCILMEKSAPEGYALAEDVTFVIEDTRGWQEYTMTDRRQDETVPGPDDETVPGPDDETVPGPDDETVPGPADETAPGSGDATVDGGLQSAAAVLPQTGREVRNRFYAAGGTFVAAGTLLLLYDRRKSARTEGKNGKRK